MSAQKKMILNGTISIFQLIFLFYFWKSLTPKDLAALSQEERLKVMDLVKSGTCSAEDAIKKIKMGTALKGSATGAKSTYENFIPGMFKKKEPAAADSSPAATLKNKASAKSFKGTDKNPMGRDRNKAVKKTLGRLYLAVAIKQTESFSLLHLTVKEAKDLSSERKGDEVCDAYVKMHLLTDPGKAPKQKTDVAPKTNDPKWDKDFTWEINKKSDMDSVRLHVSIWDNKSMGRNQFLGGMSFALSEIADKEVPDIGWFKLLDKQKADRTYQPFRTKAAGAAGSALAMATLKIAEVVKPAEKKAEPKKVEPKKVEPKKVDAKGKTLKV